MNKTLKYPESPKRPISESLHGKKITDYYQWLEDPNSDETKIWIEKQNKLSLDVIGTIEGQEELKDKLRSLFRYEQLLSTKKRGETLFYLKKDPTNQQPLLYMLNENKEEKILVDTNTSDSTGLTSLDYYFPSKDGTLIAYGTSKGGSEWSEITILNINSGEQYPEKIPRARWTSLMWKEDNSGFYYTRFPKVGEVPEGQEVFNSHVRYHELGTDPDTDQVIFAYPEKPQEYPTPLISPDERFMLVMLYRFVSNDLYLIDLEDIDNPPIALVLDSSNFYFPGIHNDNIYIRSDFEHERYALYKTTRSTISSEKWECIIKSDKDVLLEFELTKSHIVVSWLSDVSSKITIHDLNGKLITEVPIPEKGSIDNRIDVPLSCDIASDTFYFNYQNFILPARTYEYNIQEKALTVIHQPDLEIDSSQIMIKDVWYTSKDGTKVHMFIIHPKELILNANNPTILYGYGGFNISMIPTYGPHIISWVEKGGIYAIANIRGGSEHGEAWHKAGQLKNKQNVFDDFIYAAKYLIDTEYCTPNTLGIWGGSNGGLLVGAVAVQEPSLFGAVYCAVPLLDMIKYHRFSIGKTWTPEYGNPDIEEEFQWLYAYSPYHNVNLELDSPAILFKTAVNDSRVEPCHALKMTALMQNLSNIKKPILLLVDMGAGHGLGRPLDKQIMDSTRFLSFFQWRLRNNRNSD